MEPVTAIAVEVAKEIKVAAIESASEGITGVSNRTFLFYDRTANRQSCRTGDGEQGQSTTSRIFL
jgi:hypothetical protein